MDPDGLGGWLKPDAYLMLATDDDSRTAGPWKLIKPPSIYPLSSARLRHTLTFISGDSSGPHGVMPRVLITVPDDTRQEAIQGMLDQLPPPAEYLFRVCR